MSVDVQGLQRPQERQRDDGPGLAFEPQAGVAIVDRAADIGRIAAPDLAAVILRRHTSSDFQAWIDALAPDDLPRGRVIVRSAQIHRVVAGLCTLIPVTAATAPHRDALVEDVAMLAQTFAGVMAAPFVRVRLDVIDGNACRRFHRDAVTARLVCTYRGTGTQYGAATPEGDPARVFTVSTGMPILLRGSLWPESPATGLLHRSPPIEGSGETRLLLVIDPIDDPEDAV
ncbi:MAG: DUF1826 domain-containing protein [Pseudomonadota bacterium]